MNKVPRWILAGSAFSVASINIWNTFYRERVYNIEMYNNTNYNNLIGLAYVQGPLTKNRMEILRQMFCKEHNGNNIVIKKVNRID